MAAWRYSVPVPPSRASLSRADTGRVRHGGRVIGGMARTDLALIGLFALAKLLLHLATSQGYGYFRDELYYLACAEHPALGYVDHPPLSVLLVDIVRHTLGDSRAALRLLPALAGAAMVALVGLMAHALGGGRRALVLAMTGALVAPVYLALNHFYSMNAFDLFFWALIAWQMIRLIGETGSDAEASVIAHANADADAHHAAFADAGTHAGSPAVARVRARASAVSSVGAWPWIWLGVTIGLGLMNKISILWLGAGLFTGMLATRQTRQWLRTPWPWVAGVLAAAIFSPYIVWQVQHDWATLEFMRNATSQKMSAVSPLGFLLGQIKVMLPFTLPLWLAGLAYLFADPAGRRYRLLAWTYVIVFLILMLSGSSRANYLAPGYTWLFAAGGVAWERWTRTRGRWLVPALVGVLLVTGAVAAPLGLPLLPVEQYVRYAQALGERPSTEEKKALAELPQFYADMHGWESIAATVTAVYRRLPADDARVARIMAPDYGVAGAIDLFGRREGLPRTLSGHNSYWLWGPDGWDGRVLIVIGGKEDELRAAFAHVERAATIACGLCMPYENGRPVWIARGLHRPVREVWPAIKHYD